MFSKKFNEKAKAKVKDELYACLEAGNIPGVRAHAEVLARELPDDLDVVGALVSTVQYLEDSDKVVALSVAVSVFEETDLGTDLGQKLAAEITRLVRHVKNTDAGVALDALCLVITGTERQSPEEIDAISEMLVLINEQGEAPDNPLVLLQAVCLAMDHVQPDVADEQIAAVAAVRLIPLVVERYPLEALKAAHGAFIHSIEKSDCSLQAAAFTLRIAGRLITEGHPLAARQAVRDVVDLGDAEEARAIAIALDKRLNERLQAQNVPRPPRL